MKQIDTISDSVRAFFDAFETAINGFNIETISTLYAESFLFGTSQGATAVKKEDFLKVLPKRSGFFSTIGLKSTELVSLEQTKLDDDYMMAKARWRMRYEKAGKEPIADESAATYVLFTGGHSLQIVMQIDHQDLMKRVQELGLM